MMQKKGFTLAEILISVGIVGVIAAIMLPMVNKFKPDETKIAYLKSYDAIFQMMPAIVNNKLAYPIANENDNIVYSNYPLFNTKALFKIDNEVLVGNKKFCRMLATGFKTSGDINCTDDYDEKSIPTFKKSFETMDGVQYMVQTKIEKTETAAKYQSEIYIDVNGDNGENCFVTENECKSPDRFKLMVSSDGVVLAGDPLGQYFLDTRTNWKLNRDLSVTGDLISSLDVSDREKPLEFLPEGDENSKNEHYFKCGTDNNVYTKSGNYMNCWGYKFDKAGNIRMYVNKSVPDNIYVLRWLFNAAGDNIGWQLGVLPAGSNESITSMSTAIFKPGYSSADVDPTHKNAKSAMLEAYSGKTFLSGDSVCTLAIGWQASASKFTTDQSQDWLDMYDVGGTFDYGAMFEKNLDSDMSYINNPNSREQAIKNITWYLENELWNEGYSQEDLEKLRNMVKD